MNKLIKTLAIAHKLNLDYNDFQELLTQLLEIEVNEEDELITGFALNSASSRIEASEDDVTLVIGDRSLSIKELIEWVDILRLLVPYPDSCEGVFSPGILPSGEAGGALKGEYPNPELAIAIPVISPDEPLIKIDKMLWFEPSARHPQPWEWSEALGVWLSNEVLVDFGSFNHNISSSTAANGALLTRIDKAVPFYNVSGNRFWISNMFGLVKNSVAVASNADPAIGFRFTYMLGTGLYTTLFTLQETTRGMSANINRQMLNTINLAMPGTAWSFSFELFMIRSAGSAIALPAQVLNTSILAYVQFAR